MSQTSLVKQISENVPSVPDFPLFPACGRQAKSRDERVGQPRIVSRVDLCSTRLVALAAGLKRKDRITVPSELEQFETSVAHNSTFRRN